MLFLTRACLCIGTIVVLAEGIAPGDLVPTSKDAAGTLTRTAVGAIETLCRTRPMDCLAVAKSTLGPAEAPAGIRHPAGAPGAPSGGRRAGRGPSELSLRAGVPK